MRPSARFETLEFRAADGCLSIEDAVLVADLCRALARTAAAEAERGDRPPRVAKELYEAARWRAARYGVEGGLVDLDECEKAPARQVVDRLLARLRPALEEAGDWDEVGALVERALSGGNGAVRQRAALSRRGEMGDVLELLLA